jgi:hypothetical protein
MEAWNQNEKVFPVHPPSTGTRNQMDGKLKNPVHPVTSIGTGIQRKK